MREHNDHGNRWSRCSAGSRGWFWMVMRSFDECDAKGIGAYDGKDRPIASGFEGTTELAEMRAQEAAGPGAWQEHAQFAQGYLRRLAIEKRMASKTTGGSGAAPMEFVWELSPWGDNDTGFPRSCPHRYRVVRKTKRSVYIERHRFSEDRWKRQCESVEATGWWAHEIRTFVLSRNKLESGKGAYSKAHRHLGPFFMTEEQALRADRRFSRPPMG